MNGAAAGDADVGRAACTELGGEVDLATGREAERRVTRARVEEVELDAQRSARQLDPTSHFCVEHTVQGGRIVIDHPVPDLAIAVHDYLTLKGPCHSVGISRPKS